MGILISGMSLPKSCIECSFSDHQAWCLVPGDWRERYYCPDDERSECCPLIDIAVPHGRLIDADKLMVEIMDSDLDHLQRDDWKEVIQIISDATTVIEAEESKINDTH